MLRASKHLLAAGSIAAALAFVIACSGSSSSLTPTAPTVTAAPAAGGVNFSPNPGEPPPPGVGCSPGYWKNHLDDFYAVCGSVSGWTCADLLTALTCKGSDAGCRRSEAAGALNAVSGCTE